MSYRELLLSKFRVRLFVFGETTPRKDDFLENENSCLRLLAILAVYVYV